MLIIHFKRTLEETVNENEKFDKLIEELEKEASALISSLNKITDKINHVEGFLTKLKMNIPFSMPIEKEPGNPEIYWSLSWDYAGQNHSRNRLFLVSQENKENGEVKKQVFCETPLTLRLKYHKYIDTFIVKFGEFIKEYRISIEANKI